MSEPIPITIPLINPNEPGALIVKLHVAPAQHVVKGEALCTLETTKSTVELPADGDGYVVGLVFTEGQTVQVGDILGFLSDSPDWTPPTLPVAPAELQPSRTAGIRISQAALKLAQQHALDLSHISSEIFVTETVVRQLIDEASQAQATLPERSYHPNDLIVYGGGGHGKSLIDLIRILGTFSIVGVVDDGLPIGETIMGIPVLGGATILGLLQKQGLNLAANAVGGIGNIASRIAVFEKLQKAGFTCPTLVHPTAFVEESANLAGGVQIMPHAYVGSEASIGYGAIINTGAIVSHDCTLGEYANLSPGAILAGEVNVGRSSLIGMGATVNLRVKIGSHARIGNGATIKQDVPENGIVRAGTIWPE